MLRILPRLTDSRRAQRIEDAFLDEVRALRNDLDQARAEAEHDSCK